MLGRSPATEREPDREAGSSLGSEQARGQTLLAGNVTPAPPAARGYGYVARWTASGRPMIRMVEDGGPNCANVKVCRTMLGARFGAWWRNRRIK